MKTIPGIDLCEAVGIELANMMTEPHPTLTPQPPNIPYAEVSSIGGDEAYEPYQVWQQTQEQPVLP